MVKSKKEDILEEKTSDTPEQQTGQVIVSKKKDNKIQETSKAPETKNVEQKEKPELINLKGIDINKFKVNPLQQDINLSRQILRIPCKKPNQKRFFRIHPELYTFLHLTEWVEDGQNYLVAPDIVPVLGAQTHQFKIYLGMYHPSHTLFLFPVRQVDPGGRSWPAWEGQETACLSAMKTWIRMEWNSDANSYELIKAGGEIDEPPWPEKTLDEILAIAFSGNVITDIEHPVVKSLKGL